MRSPVPHHARGVSLIEMMIALAIGTFLILGLARVFSASRTAYQLSEGVSRVQENGRFAIDFIQRDLRNALRARSAGGGGGRQGIRRQFGHIPAFADGRGALQALR